MADAYNSWADDIFNDASGVEGGDDIKKAAFYDPLIDGDRSPDSGAAAIGQSRKDAADEAVLGMLTEGNWILPYANLMTILMIFFMILYGYSVQGNSVQYERAMATIQKEMGGSAEQLKKMLKQEQETEMAAKMDGYIKDKNLAEFAKVETNAQRIKISLANPILFDSGSSALKTDAAPALHEIASLIKTMPNAIVVDGHTDAVPYRGKQYRSNFELSAARAFGVIQFFIDQEHIDPARFSAFGYGEFRPVGSNETEEGRGMNRRIEINIIR